MRNTPRWSNQALDIMNDTESLERQQQLVPRIPLEIWRIVLFALPSMRDVIYTAQTCRYLYSAFVASFPRGTRTVPSLNGMFSGTKSPNSITLWLQSETNHPSRGYWIKMSQEALSGYRHRRWTPKAWTYYGEFRVSNLRPVRDGSIITVDMVYTPLKHPPTQQHRYR